MLSHPPTWRAAWTERAAAADGFWALPEPTRHFRTSAGTGTQLAEALLRLIVRDDLGVRVGTVLDIGAGAGALLTALHRLAPELHLVGLDQTARPVALPDGIGWCRDRWDVATGGWTTGAAASLLDGWRAGRRSGDHTAAPGLLAVCCEWLDDLPAAVAAYDGGGWSEVTPEASAGPGPRLPADDAAWADRWGDRRATVGSVIGSTRDRAWRWVVDTVGACGGGMAVMIDYGRHGDAPDAGLRGYAWGREVVPDPRGLMNLTAGVTVDSLQAVGEAAGARTVVLARQREVLAPAGGRIAADDVADPVRRLVRRSELARLRDPAGWGGHWWLVQGIDAARGDGLDG